LPAIAGWATR
jgi:hypothetical protein